MELRTSTDMETTENTVQNILDEAYTDAVTSANGEFEKYNQYLRDLERHVVQEIKDVRTKSEGDKEAAIAQIRRKFEDSFISEQVSDKCDGSDILKLAQQLKVHFHSTNWLETSPYTLPSVQNLLPALKINENRIEEQVEWFKNLQKLEKTSTVDPFLVEVVEVNTPNEFYIHRFCDKDKKDALYYMLNHHTHKAPAEIEPGKIYSVYVQSLKSWYRAQCGNQCGNFHVGNGPSQALYECFLFDEGRYERVPSLQFGIVPKELFPVPPLAILCHLHQFPKREWTGNEIQLFKKLASRSPLNMFVYHEDPRELTVDLSHVPRYADEKGAVSFRDMMMLQQGGPIASLKKAVFQQKIVNPVNGTCLKGVVMEVFSPSKIYVDFHGLDSKEGFEDMMKQLKTECNDSMSEVVMAVQEPQIGYCYACCWNKDWYRVIVEERSHTDRIHLFFVDTGHRLWSTISAVCLRRLPEKYMEIPAQVMNCKLDSVVSDRDKKHFTQTGINFLKKMIINQKVTAFVRGCQGGEVGSANRRETSLFVVMYLGDEIKSVNGKFTSARHGRSLRTHEEPGHNRGQPKRYSPHLVVDMPNRYTPPATPPAEVLDLNSTTASGTSNGSWLDSLAASGREMEGINDRSSGVKKNENAQTVHEPDVAAPITANGTNEEQVSKIELTDEEFAEISENLRSTEFQLAFIRSRSWITGGRKCDQFVSKNGTMPETDDYAIDVVFLSCESPESIYVRPVIYQQLYEKLQSIMKTAYETQQDVKKPQFDLGFPCAIRAESGLWVRGSVTDMKGDDLCTVRSWDDGQDYDVPSVQIFPLIEPLDLIPALAIRCSLSRVYPTVGHVWHESIDEKITEMLLAAEEIVIFTSERPQSFKLPLSAHVVFKYNSEGGPLEIPGKALANLNEKLVEMKLASCVSKSGVTPKEWPTTPSVPVPDQFLARITWLNLDGIVFLNNIAHSEKIMLDMQSSLDHKFKDTCPTSEDMVFRMNDLCIARYALDRSWYRATIIAIGEEPNSVTVRFTDYGTTDFVAVTDIRKDIAFETVPSQVIKCSLFNLKPAGCVDDSGTWTVEALDDIHKVIVDTCCNVHVKKLSPLQVCLVKEDGTDVAELLVSKGLAEYVTAPSD